MGSDGQWFFLGICAVIGFAALAVIFISIPAVIQLVFCRLIWGDWMLWITPWVYGGTFAFGIFMILLEMIGRKLEGS